MDLEDRLPVLLALVHRLSNVLRDHLVLCGLVEVGEDIQLLEMLLEFLKGLIFPIRVLLQQILLPLERVGVD